jgi:sporulation integral membrane protein YtvI
MEKVNFERIAAIVICAAAGILTVFALFKYALWIFLPFLIGIVFGSAVKKPADLIAKKTGMHTGFWGVVFYLLLLFFICLGAFFAVDRLLGELLKLAESLGGGEGTLGEGIEKIADYLSNATEKLPFIKDIRSNSKNEELWETIDSTIEASVKKWITEFASYVPKIAARTVSFLPDFFVSLAVSVISGFFFASGGVDLSAFERLLPEKAQRIYRDFKMRFVEAAKKWFRAYMLIMGMTFLELFIGFSVLGVKYSFLCALVGAFIDILPVFGVGTLLVPWAALMLLTGNQFLGVGLLVLWAIISVVRQFTEPKIVGKSLGISPVLTLLATYAGLRLFGVPGMIGAPALVVFIKAFFFGEKENKIKTDC